MFQYKFNIELSLRNGEFFQENSLFNEGNLEGNGSTGTLSTGLGIDEATADIIMPTADIIMPTAEGRTLTAEGRSPFAEVFNQ